MRLFLSITTLLIFSCTISASPMHLKTRSEGGDGLAIAKRQQASCASSRRRLKFKIQKKLNLPFGRLPPTCIIFPDGNWGVEPEFGTMNSGKMYLPTKKWGPEPPIGTKLERLLLWPNKKWDGYPEFGSTVDGFIWSPNEKWLPQIQVKIGMRMNKWIYALVDVRKPYLTWRELPSDPDQINDAGECCSDACAPMRWKWAGPKFEGCRGCIGFRNC